MELLFLNEDSVSADGSALSEIRAYAKANNITLFDEDTTLDEALLECAEGLNEAEISAMREEFAMYQESVLNEGVMGDAWDKLKEWWAKIKEWITKAIEKVVHWFWVAVTWCRKQIQVAINKLHGSAVVWVPAKLLDTKNILSEVDAATKATFSIAQTKADYETDFDKDTKKEIINKLKIKFQDVKIAVKRDKEKGEFKDVPLGTWKNLMDAALKTFENSKKAADSASKTFKKLISDQDKAFADAFKNAKGGEPSNAAELRKTSAGLRNLAWKSAKVGATTIKINRWLMGALFSCASYKKGKPKEGDKTEYKKYEKES